MTCGVGRFRLFDDLRIGISFAVSGSNAPVGDIAKACASVPRCQALAIVCAGEKITALSLAQRYRRRRFKGRSGSST
jgi:hypothetical protein